jgi:hypothetical protein
MNVNVIELLKNYPDVTLAVKGADLLLAVEYAVWLSRKEPEKKIAKKNAIRYFSPEKTAELLDVDRYGKKAD